MFHTLFIKMFSRWRYAIQLRLPPDDRDSIWSNDNNSTPPPPLSLPLFIPLFINNMCALIIIRNFWWTVSPAGCRHVRTQRLNNENKSINWLPNKRKKNIMKSIGDGCRANYLSEYRTKLKCAVCDCYIQFADARWATISTTTTKKLKIIS